MRPMPTMQTLIRKNTIPNSVKRPSASGPRMRRRPAMYSTSSRLPAEHAIANIVNTCSGTSENPVSSSWRTPTSAGLPARL
jgi:hypothetical protein